MIHSFTGKKTHDVTCLVVPAPLPMMRSARDGDVTAGSARRCRMGEQSTCMSGGVGRDGDVSAGSASQALQDG